MNNNNPTIEEMNLMYNWKPNTKKQYTIALESYLQYHNKTLQELILEAEEDEENINKLSKRRIKKRLLSYTIHLQQDKKFSPNSTKMYIHRITKIYKYHEIDLPELPRIKNTTIETYENVPTHQEIQMAIFNSKPKMKAIITFIASSGLRRSDVAKLTVQDFINATREYHHDKYNNLAELWVMLDAEKQVIIPTWKITDTKTSIPHITYNSNEATYYIIQMLRLRNHVHPEDLLFQVKPDTITGNFRRLNTNMQLGWNNNHSHFHPHALRKYFATTLTSNDVDYLATEFLLGHKLRGSSSSYYFANPEKLKNKYMRGMDMLNFTMNINYCDINSREREELLSLKKQFHEVKEEMREFREYVRQKQKLDKLAKKYGLEDI